MPVSAPSPSRPAVLGFAAVDARVDELARMLGGEAGTSRAHARSLLAAEAGRRPPAPVTPINTAR